MRRRPRNRQQFFPGKAGIGWRVLTRSWPTEGFSRLRARAQKPCRSLEAVLTEAKKYGYLIYEYQARLALGEVEMKSGKATAGRARLAALDKDATRTGFLLIARKAEKEAGCPRAGGLFLPRPIIA